MQKSNLKYVVSAPPGGLAHLLSRIIANEYNFEVSNNGSYHALSKKYSSKTTTIENFEKVLTDVDEPVVALHNFDNRDLSCVFADRIIVNIVVNDCFEIYLNNYYRKAILSSVEEKNKFWQNSKARFPSSNNYLREEFYFMYRAAVNHQIDWLPPTVPGINILFKDFYALNTFSDLLSNIPGLDISATQTQQIWNHFIDSQTPILCRVQKYQHICDQVVAGKSVDLPTDFDNVDFGIMCGMIYVQHGLDKLNLCNDVWL